MKTFSDIRQSRVGIDQLAHEIAELKCDVTGNNHVAGNNTVYRAPKSLSRQDVSSDFMPGYPVFKLLKTETVSGARYTAPLFTCIRMPAAWQYSAQDRAWIDQRDYKVEIGAVDRRLNNISQQSVKLENQTLSPATAILSNDVHSIDAGVMSVSASKFYREKRIFFESMQNGLGVASAQGRRPTMEDMHVAERFFVGINGQLQIASLQALFDGHGGKNMAFHAKDNVVDFLKHRLEEFNPQQLTDTGIFNALKLTMVDLSRSFNCSPAPQRGGATANVALLIGHSLFVANVGDSRAMLVTKDEMIPLSEDAKPTIPKYEKSILKRGGKVIEGRVGGKINIARVLGDHQVRGMTARPKITKQELKPDQHDWLLVQCCDGVLEETPASTIASLIRSEREAGTPLSHIAAKTVQTAYDAGSTDNLTVLISSLSTGWLAAHMPND